MSKTIISLKVLLILFSVYANLAIIPAVNSQASTKIGSITVKIDQYNFVSHAPLNIVNDSEFITRVFTENWTGNGTLSSPYIISNLNITSNSGSLIYIRDTRVHFRLINCFLSGGEFGIDLSNVSNGWIANNTIHKNKYGIRMMDSSSCSFTDNHIIDNESYGIWINSIVDCQFYRNSVCNNGHRWKSGGIESFDSSLNVNITDNIIIGNGAEGISLFRAVNSSVIGNLVVNNGNVTPYYNGIAILGCNNSCIVNNIVISNTIHGIYLTYSRNCTTAKNCIIANQGYGIYLEMSESVSVTDNEFHLNNPNGISQGFDNGQDITNFFMKNYWSEMNYPDMDSDGYVDIHYILDGNTNNTDAFPLVEPVIDSDNDGMTNIWEYNMSLDILNASDANNDPDNDGLTNLQEYSFGSLVNQADSDNDSIDDMYEYLMGLDPLSNDSFSDLDNDGLTNLQEYHFNSWANQTDTDNDGMSDYFEFIMDLEPRTDDSLLDLDKDGMSNLWEFTHGFNASNPSDARDDPDGDWVSNLAEYRGGSDPQDANSVPLISLSIHHFSITFILLVTGIILLTGITTRKKLKQLLVAKMNAPDHTAALKARKAGFTDYPTYHELVETSREHVEEGNRALSEDDLDGAIEQYMIAFSLSERTLDYPLKAEMVFTIASLLKEQGKLSHDVPILKDFPVGCDNDPVVRSLRNMLDILLLD